MDKSNSISDGAKKITASSMITYFRTLSVDKQEKVLKWARTSKNEKVNINTKNPSEWEKKLKKMFAQMSPVEQAEVTSQATTILNDKKYH